MTTDADVIVVGGGVLGCAIAWRLAALDRRDVLLLERNELGSGASARAAGLIVPLRPTAESAWFVGQTLAAFRELTDAGFHQVGVMHVAASAASRDRLAAMLAQAGSSCRWIAPAQAATLVPWLAAEAVTAIAFDPTGGFLDPYSATMAYARAARHAGATLMPRRSVLGITLGSDGVAGVSTPQGPIRSRAVVVAAGAWTAPLLDALGVSLPMAPVRSHYWITSPDAALFDAGQPVVMLPDAHAYARPELDRLVLGARENRSPSWDARTLPDDIATLNLASTEDQWTGLVERGPALRRFLPALDRLGMARYVGGLSTYSIDGNFVVGPADGVPGLVIAAGCNGTGIAASAGIARLVADVLAGRPSAIDRSPYKPDRCGRFDAYSLQYRERCSASRTTKALQAPAQLGNSIDRPRPPP